MVKRSKPKGINKPKRRGVYVTLSEDEQRELIRECERLTLPGASVLKSGFFQWLRQRAA